MKTPLATCLLLAPSLAGISAPPQLETVWPPGGRAGSEVEVTLTGQLDPWPARLHFSEKGLTFTPDPEKKGVGKISIAAEAGPGPVLVRALNDEGVSAPLYFLVDEAAEILEKDEDRNTVSGAETVDPGRLPLAINGRLAANNELDFFRIPLQKGEAIHAAVEGYTLRSLIDPVLAVHDAEGNRLALAHDSATHLDPRLEFTAPESGDYIFAVTAFAHPPASSVSFRGDKKALYRLHLARNRSDLPTRLFPGDLGPDSKEAALEKGKPIIGTLEKAGEIDRFAFPAKSGEQVWIRVESASLGFPTDPVLRILQPDGSELKLIDDANKENDPEHSWKVSTEGDYFIEVSDRFRRGGDAFRYRLSADDPIPDFTATVEKSEYVLEAGKSIDLKVKITRLRGHSADLAFEIPALPPSVQVKAPDQVPEKGGDVILKLEAAKEATPFQGELAIRISEKNKEGEGEKTGEAKLALFSFADANSRGPYVMMETPSIWLTIPPLKKEATEKKE